jgi:hypothetical protein
MKKLLALLFALALTCSLAGAQTAAGTTTTAADKKENERGHAREEAQETSQKAPQEDGEVRRSSEAVAVLFQRTLVRRGSLPFFAPASCPHSACYNFCSQLPAGSHSFRPHYP